MAATKNTTKSVPAVKSTYANELAMFNDEIARGEQMMAKQPNSTLLPLEVVSLYQERALLTGNYDDYTKAQTLLTKLFEQGKPSGDLCLAQAKLHYTLHRLTQAEKALDSCPAPMDAADLAVMRADLALYSGRYKEAEEIYRAFVNRKGSPTAYIRLGLTKKWMGGPGESSAFLEAAEKRYHAKSPAMLAWLKLQRGLVALDRGNLDEALALYKLAEQEMGGWWLVDEHIAEVLQLMGRTKEAKQLYENIIQRTNNPEFMDALAAIERDEGHVQKEQELVKKARAIYEQRLAQYPEATAGHALDHYLQNPDDAKFMLELAQKNVDTRPYGEASLTLAKAYMLTGKPERAVSLIEAQLKDGWDTAEAYWLLGEALQMLGKKERAEQARAQALRRNSHSEKMYAFQRADVGQQMAVK